MKILIVTLTILCTGCTGLMQSDRTGQFTLITDAAGLQAWSDAQVGLVEARPADGSTAPYWRQREAQTKMITIARGVAGGANNGK